MAGDLSENVHQARAQVLQDDIANSSALSFGQAILQFAAGTLGATYKLLSHIQPTVLMAVQTSTSIATRLQLVALNGFTAGLVERGLVSGAGVHTWSAPAAVAVGVADTAVLAATTTAKVIILSNTSAAYISIACGNAAVLYSGITLNPLGGTAILSAADGTLPVPGSTVRGIASAAASNLGVQVLT